MLFSLLLVGGEIVLLPALSLSLGTARDLAMVSLLAIAAALLSDLFWYTVGRIGGRSRRLAALRVVRRARAREWLPKEQFEVHWRTWLILSKFIYGTRTSAQLVCGATQRGIAPYLVANAVGTTLLVGYLVTLTALLARGIALPGRWTNVVATSAAALTISLLVGRGIRRVQRRHSGI